MAHTPGPWRLHPHSGTIIVNGSTVYSVKDLTTENEAGLAGDVSMDDKRLMAAAPELLGVCQSIAGDLEALLGGDDFSGMSDAELFGVMLRSLRATIAKAEGGWSMIQLNLTPQQFFYLQAAVKRDEIELEEMAPWDIDCETAAHAEELKRCREVGRLLSRVEQEQVVTH